MYARPSNRTTMQHYADRVDRLLYNLSGDLDELAKLANDNTLDDYSRQVYGMRSRVRSYMHRNDFEGTEE